MIQRAIPLRGEKQADHRVEVPEEILTLMMNAENSGHKQASSKQRGRISSGVFTIRSAKSWAPTPLGKEEMWAVGDTRSGVRGKRL